MSPKVTDSDKSTFEAITGNADGWASIDALVDACEQAGFWGADFVQAATVQAKKSHVRKLIKSLKDKEGWPVWASVETTNESGETVRVYKQETLFDIEDYRKVVNYHAGVAQHHVAMARGYARRCKKRFNKQIALPFKD